MKNKIEKSACLKSLQPDESDMEKINQYALEPLQPDEVFAFKALIGTDEDNDRNFMPFSAKALDALAKLYPGKTVVMDHEHSTKSQIARVYDTQVLTDGGKTQLTAKCYMVRTEKNKSLIADIKAGIKKEVSASFACDELRCSVCGGDAFECRHIRGAEYDGQICTHIIESCSDAYELSFVAVPAQPAAGTVKSAEDSADDRILQLRSQLEKSRVNFKQLLEE